MSQTLTEKRNRGIMTPVEVAAFYSQRYTSGFDENGNFWEAIFPEVEV